MSISTLQVYRGLALISQFDIDESTGFSKILMGDHQITCQVTLSSPLPLQLGDYITYKDRVYQINTPFLVTKTDVDYKYEINFEPDIYTLLNKLYQHNGDSNFTHFTTLRGYAQLIIDNISVIDSGWSLGEIDELPEKEITFQSDDKSPESCRTALTKIADAFNVEYDVDGKVITLKKTIGRQRDLLFKIGIYKGLYSLKRTYRNDASIATSVYGYGSDKNIDYNYRGGAKKLVFGAKKLTNNISLYKEREGIYTNDDIYPHRTGTVSAVSGLLTIIDTSLDFNLTTYLQENIPAKIQFTSGELSGVTFEVQTYDNTTKRIIFKEFKDTNNYVLPSANRQAHVGDKYVLLDINMPQSYIDSAEAELQNATQTYLNENSVPQAAYELEIDEKFIRDNNIVLNAGDFIRIQDSELAIDGYLRISEISYPLVNEAAIKATISNYIIDSSQGRLNAAILNNRTDIKQVYTGNILESRRQSENLTILKDTIFDNDGYFDGTHLKPNSIETLYLSTGSKANDFNLSEVVIKANLLGNQNDIQITDGRVLHNSIEITGLGFIWIMNGITQTGLTTLTQYWVYAKCSKNALTGTFVISSAKIGVNDVAGYYHFTIGTLYPAKDGWRDFDFTKGMAYLVGDTLRAGLIKSIDAQTYWDLTQGKFKLGTNDYGLDWNVTTPNTLTIRGAVVQSPGGATAPITVFRGPYVPGTTYFKGDSVQFNGSTWNYINATASNNQPPAENTYWTASAKKGNDGTSVNIKGTVASSTNLPTTGNTIGDGYIANDSKHLWMWTGSAWNDLGNLSGPKGDAGTPGKPTRTYFAKNNSFDTSPAFSQVFEPAGWSSVAPVTDDNVYLGDNLGNLITDSDGNYIGVGIDPEYLWVIVENLDTSGNWVSWSLPNRLTGRPASDGDFTEVRFAKNGSPTVPPSINANESDPSGWSVTPPAFGTLEYLWKVYGNKFGDTKLLIGQWSVPYRETALDGNKGDKGDTGIPGTPGADGVIYYTWIRYADNIAGSGISSSPEGKEYIGIATNKTTPNPSNNQSDYTWALFRGDQGIQGDEGVSLYTWIKYANNASGSGITDDPTGKDYIGIAINKTTASESNTPSDYTWAKTKGEPGSTGSTGPSGPLPTGGDIYSSAKSYTGSTLRVDIVRYNDGTGEKAYVTRTDAGTFSGVLPTNTSKWNAFGGQYESVATKLFFATLAYIENLGVRYVKTSESGRRMEINADTNSQSFYGLNGSAAYEALKIADDIDSGDSANSLAGLKVSNPAGNIAFISGNGVLSNASGVRILSATTGIDSNASVVGLLKQRLSDGNAISAGVAGVDLTISGASQSFASVFVGMTGLYGGVCNRIRSFYSGTNALNKDDYMIYTKPTSDITLQTPIDGLYQGRTLVFKNTPSTTGTYNVFITGGISFNNAANTTVIFTFHEGSWIRML